MSLILMMLWWVEPGWITEVDDQTFETEKASQDSFK